MTRSSRSRRRCRVAQDVGAPWMIAAQHLPLSDSLYTRARARPFRDSLAIRYVANAEAECSCRGAKCPPTRFSRSSSSSSGSGITSTSEIRMGETVAEVSFPAVAQSAVDAVRSRVREARQGTAASGVNRRRGSSHERNRRPVQRDRPRATTAKRRAATGSSDRASRANTAGLSGNRSLGMRTHTRPN